MRGGRNNGQQGRGSRGGSQNSRGNGGGRGGRGGNRNTLDYIYGASYKKLLKFENRQEFDAYIDNLIADLEALEFDPKGVSMPLTFEATEQVSINFKDAEIDHILQNIEEAAGDQQGDGGVRMTFYCGRKFNEKTNEEFDGASLVVQPKFNNRSGGGQRGGFNRGGGGRRNYDDQGGNDTNQGNQSQRSARGAGRGRNRDQSQQTDTADHGDQGSQSANGASHSSQDYNGEGNYDSGNVNW